MFKLFQEVCELQRSCLILSIGGLNFVTDEVPEQAVVSSFFFRRLMIFCPHVARALLSPAIKNRDSAKLSRELSVAIEAQTFRPTELPISKAVVSIIRLCDVSATPHQITFLRQRRSSSAVPTEGAWFERVRFGSKAGIASSQGDRWLGVF
jgi:hypothetical protein